MMQNDEVMKAWKRRKELLEATECASKRIGSCGFQLPSSPAFQAESHTLRHIAQTKREAEEQWDKATKGMEIRWLSQESCILPDGTVLV